MANQRRQRRKGNAIVEFTLLLPWLFFLFTGIFDMGFYTYALIATENAARVAAMHSSSDSATAGDQAGACTLAAQELNGLPNIGASYSGSCSADPLTVTSSYCDGTTACTGTTTSPDGGPAAYVTVTYQMPPLFRVPVPGLTHITRTTTMRLRDTQP